MLGAMDKRVSEEVRLGDSVGSAARVCFLPYGSGIFHLFPPRA